MSPQIIEKDDPVMLIIEDDAHATVASLAWRATKDLRESSPPRARWGCLSPGSSTPAAISLDIFLPDMLGWTVLDQLKLDPALRHIPVQIVSLEEERQHCDGFAKRCVPVFIKDETRTVLSRDCI